MENLEIYPVMEGTGGLRKMRFAFEGRGKSGKNHPFGSASRLLNMMESNSHLTEEYPFIRIER